MRGDQVHSGSVIMPRVSVVIPSYNHGGYICQCLESVLTQTYQNFEIVIVDDGSTDDSVEKIRAIDDRRIALEVFPQNRGACVALNAAIRRAEGDLIAVLNSDDFFLAEKLKRQVEFLDEHPEIGAVFATPLIVDQRGIAVPGHSMAAAFRRVTNVSRFEWLRRLFSQNTLCHPTLMIRRTCYDRVGLYNPRLAQLPDLEMWIRLCQCFDIHVLADELTAFRVLDDDRNASAATLEVRARGAWEMRHVLDRYLGLDRASFDSIFPGHAAGDIRKSVDRLVAEQALRMNTPVHSAFALDTLYRELGACVDEHQFAEFIRLTGVHDVHNLRIIDALVTQVTGLQEQVRQLRQDGQVLPSLSYSYTLKPR